MSILKHDIDNKDDMIKLFVEQVQGLYELIKLEQKHSRLTNLKIDAIISILGKR